MKIRTSIFCFLLIFACAGILLSRLDSRTVYDVSGVSGTDTAVSAEEDYDKDICESEYGNTAGEFAAAGALEGYGKEKVFRCTIVVDAGHGGNDPGKIGVNGVKEKDINLNIALLLREYLESQNIKVIMTRTEDRGLYSEDSANKKSEDMKNRVKLIEESEADYLVSIHQNSYTDAKYSGAQVFYYTGSSEGEKLAEIVQSRLVNGADPQNHREAKANKEYYLLKKSIVPAIICECGFLSNIEECEKLSTDQYQKTIAESIFQGIMEYLDSIQ